jgi:hypothetical protein
MPRDETLPAVQTPLTFRGDLSSTPGAGIPPPHQSEDRAMTKTFTLAAAAAALWLGALSPSHAASWSRQNTATTPNGGTASYNGGGTCSGGTCSSSGTYTGAQGNTATRQGTASCSGGSCTSSGGVTGPNGKTASRSGSGT